jgi:hypothetical protein
MPGIPSGTRQVCIQLKYNAKQQLDIFLDSEPVQRANDRIEALSLFDRAASKQALHHLKIADPNHADLPRFQVLCDFLDQGLKSSNQSELAAREAAVIADEKSIREQIIPAAAVMSHKRGALIHKYWHTLALTSEKWGIAPERQAHFSAELYWRAQQYSELVRTAQTVSGGLMRAAVQRWLGLGHYGCGAVKQGRQAVFRYAWLAPQKFDELVDEIADLELSRDWNIFQNDLDQLDASWFPAWCANQFVTGLQAGGFRRGGVCIPSTTRPQTLPFRAGWRVFRPEGRGFKPGRNPDNKKISSVPLRTCLPVTEAAHIDCLWV